eukprot:1833511-Pyramimonas_sp.AAC.1
MMLMLLPMSSRNVSMPSIKAPLRRRQGQLAASARTALDHRNRRADRALQAPLLQDPFVFYASA